MKGAISGELPLARSPGLRREREGDLGIALCDRPLVRDDLGGWHQGAAMGVFGVSREQPRDAAGGWDRRQRVVAALPLASGAALVVYLIAGISLPLALLVTTVVAGVMVASVWHQTPIPARGAQQETPRRAYGTHRRLHFDESPNLYIE